MRGYASSVLTIAVLSLTKVTAQDLIKSEAGTLVVSTFEEVNPDSFTHGPVARQVFFRPLELTRERNRDIEKFLQQQRHRNKSKNKTSRRGSAQKMRVRPKSLTIVNDDEVHDDAPDFEIPNVGDLPLNTDDSVFSDSILDENVSQRDPTSTQEVSLKLLSTRAKPGIPQYPQSVTNSVDFISSRPKRDVTANSSKASSSEVKSLLPTIKDINDVRPSSDMMIFSNPNLNQQIRDKPQNNSVGTTDSPNKKLDGVDESMKTAETFIFRPLFVHRWQKAQRNRRRQLQMRPQNRPQKKPKREQPRPQRKPATRPQQRPSQVLRPQRPASSQKKPQSTRRAHYYYVAAAGPLGQWVYYPMYHYY